MAHTIPNITKQAHRALTIFVACWLATTSGSINAYEVGSRHLATGGVTQIEGSAGSGIVPWAVLPGYGQKDEWGGEAFGTYVNTNDYELSMVGLALLLTIESNCQ